jgi:hypothetical protein
MARADQKNVGPERWRSQSPPGLERAIRPECAAGALLIGFGAVDLQDGNGRCRPCGKSVPDAIRP